MEKHCLFCLNLHITKIRCTQRKPFITWPTPSPNYRLYKLTDLISTQSKDSLSVLQISLPVIPSKCTLPYNLPLVHIHIFSIDEKPHTKMDIQFH